MKIEYADTELASDLAYLDTEAYNISSRSSDTDWLINVANRWRRIQRSFMIA